MYSALSTLSEYFYITQLHTFFCLLLKLPNTFTVSLTYNQVIISKTTCQQPNLTIKEPDECVGYVQSQY